MTTHTTTSFTSLPLPPATIENLQRLGYTAMTPIQAASLPYAMAGKDLIAQARTGSGMAAAIALRVGALTACVSMCAASAGPDAAR